MAFSENPDTVKRVRRRQAKSKASEQSVVGPRYDDRDVAGVIVQRDNKEMGPQGSDGLWKASLCSDPGGLPPDDSVYLDEPPRLSLTERNDWLLFLGERCLEMLIEVFNVPGQRPILQCLLGRLVQHEKEWGPSPTNKMGSSPETKMGSSPENKMGSSPGNKMGSNPENKMGSNPKNKKLTASILAALGEGWDRQAINKLLQQGTPDKWEWLKNLARVAGSRGKYVSPEERELILCFVASLGELDTSSANRFKIAVKRKEVYRLYLASGVKSILFSMSKMPKFETKIKEYAEKMVKEGKTPLTQKGKPKRGLIHNLFLIRNYAEKNFAGACEINFKRSPGLFWSVVKSRIVGSKRQVVKLSFANKMHPCELCSEAHDTLDIFLDLTVRADQAKDVNIKRNLLRQKDQWAKKVKLLEMHKKKCELQRRKIQNLRDNLQHKPNVCIVYEDFCNMYQANKAKMLNLVLVLVYWEGPPGDKGKLCFETYDNFCRGSLTEKEMRDPSLRGHQDTWVYKQAWVLAFENKVFTRWNTLVKTGDNGSALKNYTILHIHTLLMKEYFTRIIYSTLCPSHAQSMADAVGNRTTVTLQDYERKTGDQSGMDAQKCAAVLNTTERKNAQEAKGFEAPRTHDKYVPPDLITNKLDSWAYSLGPCCVMLPQVPDIFDNSPHPKRTIQLVDVVMVAPTEEEKFGVVDLRVETLDRSKLCWPCTKRFVRFVLLLEHDQRNYWLCLVTWVYSFETEESLKQECKHCGKVKGLGHVQGKDNPCPSLDDGTTKHRHLSFWAESTSGFRRFFIKFPCLKKDKSKPNFSEDYINEMKTRYDIRKRDPIPLNVGDKSRAAALMLAPGIIVLYKKQEFDRDAGDLPWGLGRCVNVDHGAKSFTVNVFNPVETAPMRAPLSQWKETDTSLQIKEDAVWIKALKVPYGRIDYTILKRVEEDSRFEWKWITHLVCRDPPEALLMEEEEESEDEEDLDDREAGL